MTEDEYDMADEVEFWTGLGERLNDAVRAMVADAVADNTAAMLEAVRRA